MLPERTEQNKEKVLEYLSKSKGIVTDACKMAGVGRTQYYAWLKDDPEFKERVKEVTEEAIDFVESKLFELINWVTVSEPGLDGPVIYERPPCKTSTIFYLKTKAKHRGYVERTEVQEVVPVKIEIIDGL